MYVLFHVYDLPHGSLQAWVDQDIQKGLIPFRFHGELEDNTLSVMNCCHVHKKAYLDELFEI
jgi:hypothetical protein